MTTTTTAITRTVAILLGGLLALGGCGTNNGTTATNSQSGTGTNSDTPGKDGYAPNYAIDGPEGAAGGAPSFGPATGTGFSAGDAVHSSGGGSGLMGFHGTGKMGTTWAISDVHQQPKPDPKAPQPVLPEQ